MASKATYSYTVMASEIKSNLRQIENPDMLERFRDPKVCDIPATSAEPKPDIFDLFRPKPRTVLDYYISQTDIKGQKKEPTGFTKFHVQQTTAKYELPPPGYVFPVEETPPPPPPEPSTPKLSRGRGPVWVFIEDIWRRKVEKEQELHYKQLKNLIAQNKRIDKEQKARAHVKLLARVGPDWFQELSPKQLRTVDNLKNCIVKDVKNKTICNTEANVAQLGLVLRPDPRHIKLALKKCCECPVEFLLLLYQLMNRRRTDYSLNDRLLLSGVVHLTMRETLKELHIRIPSPPPPLKKEKPPKKKPKEERYKSPYLVPFTFKPEPPKHTGIYKYKHIQYPESPYFSYISELKSEELVEVTPEFDEDGAEVKVHEKTPKIIITRKQSGITLEQEKELIAELRAAQHKYNDLVNYKPVPFLHKPSIYIPCDHALKKAVATLEEDEIEDAVSSENETNATVSVEVRVTTDFDEQCQPIRKICECKITLDETKVPKHSGIDGGKAASVCEEEDDKGDDLTSIPPLGVEKTVIVEKKSVAVSTQQGESTKSMKPTKEPSSEKLKVFEKKPVVDLKEVSEQEHTLKVTDPPDGLLHLEEKEEEEEKLVTVGRRDSSECKCKEEAEKFIETNLCQCEKCKAHRLERQAAKKPTFVISEMQKVEIRKSRGQEVEGGEEKMGREDQHVVEEEIETAIVPVIVAVKPKPTCICLEQYQARVKKYEEMKKRFDAQHDLMTLQQQYIVGGITHSPDGEPVYMLDGVVPEHECPCAQAYREQLEEEKRLANMPTIPLRKQKYIISGVRETEQGNVFVISAAAASEDCACMKMYKAYEKRHMSCIEAYQQYLLKIEMDKKEYMTELVSDGRFPEVQSQMSAGEEHEGAEGDDHVEDLNDNQMVVPREVSKHQDVQKDIEPKKEISKETLKFPIVNAESEVTKQNEVCHCGEPDDDLTIDTELELTLEINKKEGNGQKNRNVCVCEPDYTLCVCQKVDPLDCQCGADDSEESIEAEVTRFIILDKIPCKLSQQMEIIKKALALLAEDGFPLAKLPESYKLPHFKLWMQLRCGKYWTQEDRVPLLMKSYGMWRHGDICHRKVKIPKLKMSLAESNKYTWAQAIAVRKMAMEKDVWFYRKLRQANVGDGREYFPTTFSYELPTWNFRDCYFAYTSSKEENCVCWKPWYPHEMKDMSRRKPCM